MLSKFRATFAYASPFILFMALLALSDGVQAVFHTESAFLLHSPKYWIFPVQTVLCGALLLYFRRQYALERPRLVSLTVISAVAVFVIWISPQAFLRFPPRYNGFDPTAFGCSGPAFLLNTGARFLRLVIVVPFLEEVFWRGFLLRYLIEEDFEHVPFGTFSWMSFGGVAILFGFAHYGPDFVPALLTGAIYNFVAYRTKSLSSCVLAHSLTNLLLGFYIMDTGQWGFW